MRDGSETEKEDGSMSRARPWEVHIHNSGMNRYFQSDPINMSKSDPCYKVVLPVYFFLAN